MKYIIAKFNSNGILAFGEYTEDIKIHAYIVTPKEDWEDYKALLKEHNISFQLYVGENKEFKNLYIYFERGEEFLECCEETEMNQAEYDAFTNVMPTYFGEADIFEDVAEIINNKKEN